MPQVIDKRRTVQRIFLMTGVLTSYNAGFPCGSVIHALRMRSHEFDQLGENQLADEDLEAANEIGRLHILHPQLFTEAPELFMGIANGEYCRSNCFCQTIVFDRSQIPADWEAFAAKHETEMWRPTPHEMASLTAEFSMPPHQMRLGEIFLPTMIAQPGEDEPQIVSEIEALMAELDNEPKTKKEGDLPCASPTR